MLGTRHPGIQNIQGLVCLVLGIPGYKVFKDCGVQANQPSGDIPGQYQVSWDTKYSRIEVSRPTSHLGTSQASTRYPGMQSIQGLGCLGQPAIWGHPRLVLGISGYKVFKDQGVQANQPSGDIPGWYQVSRDTKYSRIRVSRPTSHLGTSQAGARYPGIQGIQGQRCLGQPAIWGHPRLVLGIPGYKVFKNQGVQANKPSGDIPGWYQVSWDTKYSRIRVSRPTSHLGTSQAGTRYPGIQSIQGLGCLGQPAIWGHPRLVLGILEYKVFKDRGAQANQPSGDIPGWYQVSWDTKYSRIRVSRPTSHLGTSQAGTRYPGIQSIQGLGCLGQPAIWGHPRLVLGILEYKVFKDRGAQANQPSGDIPGWYQVSWDTKYSRIKTHGSESRGQEEAACMCVFWPTRPLQ